MAFWSAWVSRQIWMLPTPIPTTPLPPPRSLASESEVSSRAGLSLFLPLSDWWLVLGAGRFLIWWWWHRSPWESSGTGFICEADCWIGELFVLGSPLAWVPSSGERLDFSFWFGRKDVGFFFYFDFPFFLLVSVEGLLCIKVVFWFGFLLFFGSENYYALGFALKIFH